MSGQKEFEAALSDDFREAVANLLPGQAYVFRVEDVEYVTMTRETIDTIMARANIHILGDLPGEPKGPRIDDLLKRFIKPRE